MNKAENGGTHPKIIARRRTPRRTRTSQDDACQEEHVIANGGNKFLSFMDDDREKCGGNKMSGASYPLHAEDHSPQRTGSYFAISHRPKDRRKIPAYQL